MHIQDSHWQTAVAASDGNGRVGTGPSGGGSRSAPLRVDAQRNLEHVLRAAREVFGELGYGAPMEDVARRARVGVGTVYRRFPSKDVLVRRIAEEETSRLTDQARTALGQEDEPWSALSRFLRTSVASGAGRLLPPQVLRVGRDAEESDGVRPEDVRPEGSRVDGLRAGGVRADGVRADGVRADGILTDGLRADGVRDGLDEARVPQQRQVGLAEQSAAWGRVVEQRSAPEQELDDAGAAELLDVVGQLVDRARAAGELRVDVTVADVLLVIATAAPSLPDATQQAAASARLLDILLEGLRSRPS
ncbi:TetR/AcrR family transcriptional regulator [Streptomyces sp. MBT27]|uniref:TetR/AcrR family transcriptional regulator n=1 Tax=Streptomyces sp. MBT27 TaxID=1488356 RepID=UPI0014231F7A|nr:TetR/AcrR family transcriptional regulator [Streptomyces sp. MBT27]